MQVSLRLGPRAWRRATNTSIQMTSSASNESKSRTIRICMTAHSGQLLHMPDSRANQKTTSRVASSSGSGLSMKRFPQSWNVRATSAPRAKKRSSTSRPRTSERAVQVLDWASISIRSSLLLLFERNTRAGGIGSCAARFRACRLREWLPRLCTRGSSGSRSAPGPQVSSLVSWEGHR